jgi:hypothetical protein
MLLLVLALALVLMLHPGRPRLHPCRIACPWKGNQLVIAWKDDTCRE